MRSRDFRKYIIVTKRPDFTIHKPDGRDQIPEQVKELTSRGQDKTFWLFEKQSGDLVGRYSVDSAPKYIMEIYNILTNGTSKS